MGFHYKFSGLIKILNQIRHSGKAFRPGSYRLSAYLFVG
jgi:hypothetical protein